MKTSAVSIEYVLKFYIAAGSFLRRRDASIKKPSPLIHIGELLKMAAAELVASKRRLRPKRPTHRPSRSYNARHIRKIL